MPCSSSSYPRCQSSFSLAHNSMVPPGYRSPVPSCTNQYRLGCRIYSDTPSVHAIALGMPLAIRLQPQVAAEKNSLFLLDASVVPNYVQKNGKILLFRSWNDDVDPLACGVPRHI
jgi:hypothetical protein